MNSKTIAFSGKGGTGKTTLSSLTVKFLLDKKFTPVLAVDADPNANLNECLGVAVNTTVADIRENTLAREENIPPGMSKIEFVQYQISRTLVEANGFDLLSMGKPEGPGCYCYANNLIRKFVDQISEKYRFVVIDTEAGMEHFSRRTTQKVDLLITVSDYSLRGVKTAVKIKSLAHELKLKIEKNILLINRAPEKFDDTISSEIEKNKLTLGGIIPQDEIVRNFDVEGKPLVELPKDAVSYQALTKILDKFIKI